MDFSLGVAGCGLNVLCIKELSSVSIFYAAVVNDQMALGSLLIPASGELSNLSQFSFRGIKAFRLEGWACRFTANCDNF